MAKKLLIYTLYPISPAGARGPFLKDGKLLIWDTTDGCPCWWEHYRTTYVCGSYGPGEGRNGWQTVTLIERAVGKPADAPWTGYIGDSWFRPSGTNCVRDVWVPSLNPVAGYTPTLYQRVPGFCSTPSTRQIPDSIVGLGYRPNPPDSTELAVCCPDVSCGCKCTLPDGTVICLEVGTTITIEYNLTYTDPDPGISVADKDAIKKWIDYVNAGTWIFRVASCAGNVPTWEIVSPIPTTPPVYPEFGPGCPATALDELDWSTVLGVPWNTRKTSPSVDCGFVTVPNAELRYLFGPSTPDGLPCFSGGGSISGVGALTYVSRVGRVLSYLSSGLTVSASGGGWSLSGSLIVDAAATVTIGSSTCVLVDGNCVNP